MVLELILGGIVLIAQTILAYLVWSRNRKSWTNRLYVLLAFLLNSYVIINYISLHPPTADSQLFWIRTVMFVTSLIGPILVLFVHTFNQQKVTMRPSHITVLLATMCASAGLAYTPFVFSDLLFMDGMPLPQAGAGIVVFLVDFPGLFLVSFIILAAKYRNAAGIFRKQLKLLFIGNALTFSLMAICSVILVVFFKNSSLVFLSPLVPLIMLSCMAYAIVQYRFLDVRLYVRQGTIHLLTNGVVLFLLSAIVVLLHTSLAQWISMDSITVLLIGLLLVAFVFEPIKQKVVNTIVPWMYSHTEQERFILAQEARRVERLRINNNLSKSELDKAKRLYNEIDSVLGDIVRKLRIAEPDENVTLLVSDHHTRLFQTVYGYKKHLTVDPTQDISLFFKDHADIIVAGELVYLREANRYMSVRTHFLKVEQFMKANQVEIMVPLKLSNKLLGFALVHSGHKQRSISSQDIQVLEDFRRSIYFEFSALVAQRTAARDIL